ncbi:YraN family protein [Kordiimonas laminariae]|uniref:YraN family protein n=1 Tax=Kordiimonas laminariae TaxID=2917717 RepID=UPI001FF67FC8|nr:YraN family protein [Kordiimonas laminariae]MCK0070131.1 YraN family protein [Kordiimonas laminariae]
MTTERQKSEARGRKAEKIAANWLRLKGYTILEERFRSKRGEIDIICKRGCEILIVEVKAHKTRENSLYAVTPRQQQRIVHATEDWLKTQSFEKYSLRFDVIAIAPKRLPAHIKDAWRPGF